MTGLGLLTRLDSEAAVLRTRLETLTRQVADGRRGPLYGDIAPEARRAVDLRGEIGRREAYQGMVDRALGRTQAAQATLSRLHAIASDFAAEALRLTSLGPAGVESAAELARSALVEAAQLLNARHAGEHLFGGSDSANRPIPDAEGMAYSPFAMQIAAQVGGLALSGAAAVAAATRAIAQSDAPGTTPFSAFLSDPAAGGGETRRSLPAADGERVEHGLFANRNAAARSEGETTGSWARDLLRGLATLAAIGSTTAQAGGEYEALLQTVAGGLQSAAAALGEEQGLLGAAERRLESVRERHAEVSDALALQLSAVEEVDMAETIARLQATKTHLEASYQAMATVGELTLARFLR